MTPPMLALRRFAGLELAVAVLLLPPCFGEAFALTATKAEDICPSDADPCVVSDRYELAAASVLDFGARTLAITATGRFSASADSTIVCGRLEVTGSPDHRAIVAKGSHGTLQVNVLRRCSNQASPCFDDRDCAGGTCSAGDGSVDFGGALKATSTLVLRAAGPLAMRGTIVSTGGDSQVRLKSSRGVSLLGPVEGDDGTLFVEAGEDILVAAPIDIGSSQEGGTIRLWADRDLVVRNDVTSISTGGVSGSIGLDAGRDLVVEGPDGGPVRIEASSLPTEDHGWGFVDLSADRDLTVSANTSLIVQGDDSDIAVSARRDLVVRGSVRSLVEGGEGGPGEVLLRGRRKLQVEASASFELSGRKGSGYEVLRVRSDGAILFDGTVRAFGAGSESIGFDACLVRLGPTADIFNAMEQSDTTFLVQSAFFALAGSTVTTQHGRNLVGVRSFADPFAADGAFAPELSVLQLEHLEPCVTCGEGDGIEVCEDDNECTTEHCGESGCESLPDDSLCDDGLFCTGAEHCDAEEGCVREAAVDCSLLDAGCTKGVCDEASESCIVELLRCEDGIFCNGTSVCDGHGGCLPGTPPDCSYLDGECVEGRCAPFIDYCVAAPIVSPVPCDDADPCTNGDSCLLGECKGARDVACGDCGNASIQWGEDCDDGNLEFERGEICGPDCRAMPCGRPLGNPDASASDALFALRAAVGMDACDRLMCDVDYRGGVTASDALIILRAAVGIGEFVCYFDLLA